MGKSEKDIDKQKDNINTDEKLSSIRPLSEKSVNPFDIDKQGSTAVDADEKTSSTGLISEDSIRSSDMEEKNQRAIRNYSAWQTVGESVVGMAHRRNTPPVVCQDAYCLSNTQRVTLAVCDGAGSSIMSEVGSSLLSQSIVRLVCSLEPIICDLLDSDNNQNFGNTLAQILYNYSIRLLQDIASNHKRNIKDFRTTLLLVVTGTKNIFWLKVGDGEIVIEKDGVLECIGELRKGEFSNETVFIDENLKVKDVQYGLLDIECVCGISVMSDGTSERIVSVADRKKIGGRLSEYFNMLRDSKLPREELYKFLTNYDDWKGTTHDDKTIVIAARREIL